jgi:hypothetical protein
MGSTMQSYGRGRNEQGIRLFPRGEGAWQNISIGAIISIIVLANAGGAKCDEPALQVPPDLILQRFTVAKGGDNLKVPVSLGGTDYLFVVETGAPITIFDTSLPLGHPVDVASTFRDTNRQLRLYNSPDAKLGGLSLRTLEVVAGQDLRFLSQRLGYPVHGLLGMDFLGKHVVQIDIEKGNILFLKSAPKNAGTQVPILWEPGESQSVRCKTSPHEEIGFLIHTGGAEATCGSLGVLEARTLVQRGEDRQIGRSQPNPSQSFLWYRGGTITLGGFVVRSPVFCESYGRAPNTLSRGFWSRFVATFDFPERKLYLRKSSHFSRQDRWNGTGLHLWRRKESAEVHWVDLDSPAPQAGLKTGDVVVRVNDLDAKKTTLFELQNLLCDDGPFLCVVRRGSQEMRFAIRPVTQSP